MWKLVIYAVLFSLASVSVASASTRHALVIGNSNYSDEHRLKNPRADAIGIARQLRSMDYRVFRNQALLDLEVDEFNEAINTFFRSVSDGDIVVFYYAGHGASSDRENYLIPILPDYVKLETKSDIRNRSISLQSVMERADLHNANGVNVFFIDACRDAPVERSLSRSINLTGMAALDEGAQPKGSFVGFATEYGKIAQDGNSANSPFTEALLHSMETQASSPIELMYKNVSDRVFLKTAGAQFPIQEPKIQGNYCLVPCDVITRVESDPVAVDDLQPNLQEPPRAPEPKNDLFSARNVAIGAAAILLLGILVSQDDDSGGGSGFPFRITPPPSE